MNLYSIQNFSLAPQPVTIACIEYKILWNWKATAKSNMVTQIMAHIKICTKYKVKTKYAVRDNYARMMPPKLVLFKYILNI